VVNDESGQSMESMEEVPFIRLDESEFQKSHSLSHLTRKQPDDRYDLNQLRTEPWIPTNT